MKTTMAGSVTVLMVTVSINIALAASDNYKKAYEALKKNDCNTAVPLLENELSNDGLSSDVKNMIARQIDECKVKMAKSPKSKTIAADKKPEKKKTVITIHGVIRR